MRYMFLFVFLTTYTTDVFAQSLPSNPGKPPVDTSTLAKWLSVKTTWFDARCAISNDGNYALYKIRENWRLPATLIVQAINGNWKMEFQNIENTMFTADSRKAVFIKSKDSLCLLTLGVSSTEYIPQVSSFRLFKQGESEWLAYQINNREKEFVLRNLATGKQQSFKGVADYLVSDGGNTMLLIRESKKDSVTTQTLNWVSQADGDMTAVWQGSGAGNFVLDHSGSQLAFVVENKVNNQTEKSFWYYKVRAGKAVQLANNQSSGIDKGLQLDKISAFSKKGSKLFIRLIEQKDATKPNPDAVNVDVWSYTDAKLQSAQLRELYPKSYTAVLDVNDHRIIRLQLEDDNMAYVDDPDNEDFLCMSNWKGEEMDEYWNAEARRTSYIVSSDNGERRRLKNINREFSFSPDGRWLVGLEETLNDFYSYEITTGITHNLTKILSVPVLNMVKRDDLDMPQEKHSRGLRFAGWLDDGNVLIYDEYDIWKIDPSGRKTPVNLTNSYGRKNKIEFRLAGMYSGKIIPGKGGLILNAFDKTNKNSGFYRLVMGKKGNPEILSMGPYIYDPGYNGSSQIRARGAEVYMLMRESATESPNYFSTTDFKTFHQLSGLHPEKKYNWLTSELVAFTTLDGRTEQGVLYKPENFDPQKKYPVIIHYYERKSQDLNLYRVPGDNNILNGGELDIAWFASHGYIVFTPDIHYKTGEIGQGAVNSIIAAAKFISKYPWVDVKHIGIQGHSFGGYETNYAVTQTNLFAAACSNSGLSDLVSEYGTALRGGNQSFFEVGQMRMGASLWERPDLYIKNSPIFQADKVTTPILIIANKKDENVSFAQGMEWFLALRRLGKKAWMLQYDEESHGVCCGKDYKDYLIRTNQFFDHYLKGAPAPKWMVEGIPARLKGIDNGLELEPPGVEPGRGLLTPEAQREVDILQHRKPITVTIQ